MPPAVASPHTARGWRDTGYADSIRASRARDLSAGHPPAPGAGRSPSAPPGREVAGFNVETAINPKDFGPTWNVALEAGGVLVSDTVRIFLLRYVLPKSELPHVSR